MCKELVLHKLHFKVILLGNQYISTRKKKLRRKVLSLDKIKKVNLTYKECTRGMAQSRAHDLYTGAPDMVLEHC